MRTRAVRLPDAAQLRHLRQVEHRDGVEPAEVDLDHDVRAALQHRRVGLLGAHRERLVEGGGPEDLHRGILAAARLTR